MASPGSVARTVGSCKATGGMRGVKRLEPHGREQGAIDLQGPVRSKPSESGGTTRTEGVRRQAASGRRQQVLSGAGSRERTHRAWTAEGRSLDNPKRGSLDGLVRKRRELRQTAWEGEQGKTAHTGLCLRRRREGQEGWRRGREAPDATGLGKPRGPGATVPRSRRNAGKTNDPHLVLVMARSRCFGKDGWPATLKSPRTSREVA